MTIDQALYKYLSTYAGLIALTSTRIYPLAAPQGAALPLVVYQRIDDPPTHAMGSDAAIYQPRYQITAWGSTYAGAQAVAAQVKTALRDYTGVMGGAGGVTVQRVFYEGSSPGRDAETGEYYERQDYIIWHE